MRNLQRLRHTRADAPAEESPGAQIHRLSDHRVRRREIMLWLRRVRRFGLLLGIALLAAAVVVLVSGTRVVADGTVRANVVTVTSPGHMRIAKWHVQAGLLVSQGAPLVALEPVAVDTHRAVLDARVAAAKSKLTWFDAGGETEVMGASLRIDQVLVAERNRVIAGAEAESLEAALVVAERQVRLAKATLAEVRAKGEELVNLSRTRRSAAFADLKRAGLESDLAARSAARAQRLADDGIQSRASADIAETARAAELAVVASRRSDLEAIDAETVAAGQSASATLNRAVRDVEVAAAKKAVAEALVRSANRQADVWGKEADHHRSFVTEDPLDPAKLRAARRSQLEADVAIAEAVLLEHDSLMGPRTLYASADGTIDEVLYVEGAVVHAGDVLVRAEDDTETDVVVYVSPSTASFLTPGARCTVRCLEDGSSASAAIASVGSVWVENRTSGAPGAQIAVTLELDEGVNPFSPGAHVKASFETDRLTATKQSVRAWLTK